MLIDSHAHLDFYAANPSELDQVLDRAWQAGVKVILAIGIGEGPSEMHKALDLATAAPGPAQPQIFATAGIHPERADLATPEALAELERLARHDRCVAVGEIGLDYYHLENPDIPVQKAAFVAQMEVAVALGKPITIHCRTSELATPKAKERYAGADAARDTYDLIARHFQPSGLAGIMHCFSGSVDDARRALEMGFYLSFAGNLTYPKAQNIRDAALFAPADRILVETDAPFLAPVPLRGQRNEPAHVSHTALALAQLRGVSPEEIASITTENFFRLFPSTRTAGDLQ